MGDYRHIDTGETKTQGQWRSHYKNVSLPRTWTAATLDGLKLEPIFETPKPEAGQYQNAVRNGVEKDANGNWVWGWAIRDMFSDYTDEDGVTHTKAEQEAAYQAGLDEKTAEGVRKQRATLLADTDWMALSDSTLTAEWATYRQALRDITNHVNFPYLTEEDWPTKP
jgi:hypothetical protein